MQRGHVLSSSLSSTQLQPYWLFLASLLLFTMYILIIHYMCMLVMLHWEFDSVLTICILESCILTNTICYKNFIISVQWLIAVSNHESIICSCSLHKQYNTIYTLRLRNSDSYCNNTVCLTCFCVLLMQPNPDLIKLGLIDERTLNLSTAMPTIVAVNTVATETHSSDSSISTCTADLVA